MKLFVDTKTDLVAMMKAADSYIPCNFYWGNLLPKGLATPPLFLGLQISGPVVELA